MRPGLRKWARLLLLAPLWTSSAGAHEFWLEPLPAAMTMEPGGTLEAHIKVGTMLEGETYAFLPDRFHHFLVIDGGEARQLRSVLGDLPAVRETLLSDGIATLVYASRPSRLVHDDPALFQVFLEEEGLDGVLERHRARELPERGFAELFSRDAKALVAVGSGEGADRAIGLPHEIVLETNPYTAPRDATLTARLLWQGLPAADTQIAIFRRAPDGEVSVIRLRTDPDGRVSFTAGPGFYLLSAVRMLEASPAEQAATGAVWHSIWASSTFSRPDSADPAEPQ